MDTEFASLLVIVRDAAVTDVLGVVIDRGRRSSDTEPTLVRVALGRARPSIVREQRPPATRFHPWPLPPRPATGQPTPAPAVGRSTVGRLLP